LLPQYQGGLLQSTEQASFTARSLIVSLQDYIETAVHWMSQYQLDPTAVELAFGIEEKPLPAWEIELGEGHRLSFRGKIDRIDLWRHPTDGTALCAVLDYKSSARRLDPILMAHGIQLQLLAYLNVLRALEVPRTLFGVKQLIPAGVFYVNLRGRYANAKTRSDALGGFKETRALAYQHTGRFDIGALPKFDSRAGVEKGDQFNYHLLKNGQIHGGCREALDSTQFQAVLDSVEDHLRRMGREIYAGRIELDPYRKGNTSACDQCEYQSICRIDPWTHSFRVLRQETEHEAKPSPNAT
jgi:ATP-dependent helicase/nuclease subunit B